MNKDTPMNYPAGTVVMAPFRSIIRPGDSDRHTIFGNDQRRVAEVLPRHTGKIGNGVDDWTEERKRAPSEDQYGNYLVRCKAYGHVVLAHRSELVYVGEAVKGSGPKPRLRGR